MFARKAEKLLTEQEHEDLLLYLSIYYKAGDEIRGTGGVRKLRFALMAGASRVACGSSITFTMK